MNLSRILSVFQSDESPISTWLVSLISAFLFAIFAILTLQSPLNHFSTIDPILYESYIHNYKEIIRLYGYTYYSSRIAWIFPAHAIYALLGDVSGYYVLRIFMLGSAATAFGILVGRFCRWQFILYATAWFCLFPLILRSFADDYVAGAAITYCVIAVACVLTARPHAYIQHAIGGIFFALALNTYPMSFIIPASIAIAWFVMRNKTDDETNILNMLSAAGGFALTYFGIWLALRSEFSSIGKGFELFPTSTISILTSGGSAVWFTGLSQIFLTKGEYYKLYPVFLALALFVGYVGYAQKYDLSETEKAHQKKITILMTTCLSLVIIYMTMHFGFSAGVISVPWAYVFSVPMSGLSGIFLLNLATPKKYINVVCFVGIFLLFLTLFQNVMDVVFPIPRIIWLVAGIFIVVAGLLVSVSRIGSFALLSAASILFFPLGFYFSAFGGCGYTLGKPAAWHAPSYVACMRQPNVLRAEEDLRHGTFQLLDEVNSQLPAGQKPGLWYANNTGFADEVGSAFLWQYSRVASTETGDPGMPKINAFSQKAIDSYSYLVLIGRSPAELDAGQQALAKDGYAVSPVVERKAGGSAFSFFYRIVHKRASA